MIGGYLAGLVVVRMAGLIALGIKSRPKLSKEKHTNQLVYWTMFTRADAPLNRQKKSRLKAGKCNRKYIKRGFMKRKLFMYLS